MANIEYQKKAATILKITREKSGKTQEEMARSMGICRQTINNWECGYSFPKFPDVILWFETLHLSGAIISDCYTADVLDDILIHAQAIVDSVHTERSVQDEK